MKFRHLLVPLLLLAPQTAHAEDTAGIFPAPLADTLLVISLVFSLALLIGFMYLFVNLREIAGDAKTAGQLRLEVKALQKEIATLKGQIGEQMDEPQEREPEKKTNRPTSPWQSFVDDYNHLARSMDIPKSDIACQNFVTMHDIKEIPCVLLEGETKAVKATGEAVCWAVKFPGEEGKFVAVPNLLRGYDDAAHFESGMKETFASNFEGGAYRHIQAKLPAILRQKDGVWYVVTPGVLSLAR